jgi:hypothetical protein
VLGASLPSLIIWKTNCAVHDDKEEGGHQTERVGLGEFGLLLAWIGHSIESFGLRNSGDPTPNQNGAYAEIGRSRRLVGKPAARELVPTMLGTSTRWHVHDLKAPDLRPGTSISVLLGLARAGHPQCPREEWNASRALFRS